MQSDLAQIVGHLAQNLVRYRKSFEFVVRDEGIGNNPLPDINGLRPKVQNVVSRVSDGLELRENLANALAVGFAYSPRVQNPPYEAYGRVNMYAREHGPRDLVGDFRVMPEREPNREFGTREHINEFAQRLKVGGLAGASLCRVRGTKLVAASHGIPPDA